MRPNSDMVPAPFNGPVRETALRGAREVMERRSAEAERKLNAPAKKKPKAKKPRTKKTNRKK